MDGKTLEYWDFVQMLKMAMNHPEIPEMIRKLARDEAKLEIEKELYGRPH